MILLREIISNLSTRELIGAMLSVVLLLVWSVVVLCYPTIMEYFNG